MTTNNVIFFLLITLFPCRICAQQKKNDSTYDIVADSQAIYIGFFDFKLLGNLERTNRVNEEKIEKQSFLIECNDWYLKEQDVFQILKEMEQVEASTAHLFCYYYPCWYTGRVSNGEAEYDMTIYAHSAITLSNENQTLFFIQKEKSDLFIIPCDCCE